MPSYTTSQRISISQFISFTQAKESIAAKFLKAHDWNVERALDSISTPKMPGNKKRKRDQVQTPLDPAPPAKQAKIPISRTKPPSPSHQDSSARPSQTSTMRDGPHTRRAKGKPRKRMAKGNGFYQSGSGNATVSPIQQNLSKLFDQYRDNPEDSPDSIGIDGAQQYLTDLGVELDEVAHLGICDLLQCPSIGEFERETFISGWRGVSTGDKPYDTTSRQAQYVELIRRKLVADPAFFKQVYRNAFKLAKPDGQRSVPVESAVDFWTMFFSSEKGGIEWNTASTKWLDLWTEFYQSHCKRPVNKDLWNMVGELVAKTREANGETLEWWNENGAWPMAIDDFVSHVKEQRKTAGDSMDTS